jgi:ribonuclease BN (tRNA processing enzyme)
VIRELQKRTHVVLLGTGTPNANPARHGPSLAVVVKGRPFLVDCGPGLLVLHHQLWWGSSESELLAELRAKYHGPVVSGRDLMLIGVSADFARARAGRTRLGSIRAVRLAP